MSNSTTKIIPISQLLLHQENYRLGDLENQRETLHAMILDQKQGLDTLAEDIVERGLNPSESFIVTPSYELKGNYIVLEGNRRLTALKLLVSPELAKGIISKTRLVKYHKLSSKYKNNPIHNVSCCIFKDAEKAFDWIELKHTGKNKGKGVTPWSSEAKARFEQKRGKIPTTQNITGMELINLAKEQGLIAGMGKKPSVTNLGRLFTDPYVREKTGISREGSKLTISPVSSGATITVLRRILNDFTSGKTNVNDIYYKEDRKKYIDKVLTEENTYTHLEDNTSTGVVSDNTLPMKGKALNTSLGRETSLISSTPNSNYDANSSLPSAPQKKQTAPSFERNSVIPKKAKISISDGKINNIYHELKKIPVDDFPNATSVLLRTFIELSIENFLKKVSAPLTSSFAGNLNATIKYLKDNKIKNKEELKPIEKELANVNSLVHAQTMHAYVHNPVYQAKPNDLKITWDNIQPFIKAMWETLPQ